jgi:hypothetical protein
MDTIETQAPAGSDDVTSSPDTAQVDAQTVETKATQDDGSLVETGANENLLAGKYKSPEELVNAYKELEGKLGDLGQKAKVADLLQEKYGVTPEQLRAQIEQQEYQQQQQRYAQDPMAPLLDKVTALEQKLAVQEQEKALNTVTKELDTFVKNNPAYEAHRDKILKLALTPNIGFDPTTGKEVGLDEIAKDYFGTARAQGQQDAYKKIETKEMTQATGVSRGAPKGKLTLEDLRGMSVAEQEAVLPHAV